MKEMYMKHSYLSYYLVNMTLWLLYVSGYLATPAFELDISDRRDAKLDLFVHISGPVCLQVIYINCVKDLKMKILLKTSDNDYITVLRDTGENTCDEKVCHLTHIHSSCFKQKCEKYNFLLTRGSLMQVFQVCL